MVALMISPGGFEAFGEALRSHDKLLSIHTEKMAGGLPAQPHVGVTVRPVKSAAAVGSVIGWSMGAVSTTVSNRGQWIWASYQEVNLHIGVGLERGPSLE